MPSHSYWSANSSQPNAESYSQIHTSCHQEVGFPAILSHMVAELTALLKGKIKLGGWGVEISLYICISFPYTMQNALSD